MDEVVITTVEEAQVKAPFVVLILGDVLLPMTSALEVEVHPLLVLVTFKV